MIDIKRWFRHEYELLRDPARLPKCYDMTEQERRDAIVRLNRNVWNAPELAKFDSHGKSHLNSTKNRQ